MSTDDFDYTPEQRGRNQFNILLATAVVLGIVIISGTLQGWSKGSFITFGAVILFFGFAFWKLFASRSARPLSTSKPSARSPYLKKTRGKDSRKPPWFG